MDGYKTPMSASVIELPTVAALVHLDTGWVHRRVTNDGKMRGLDA